MPPKVERCVESVMEENPDMPESQAWAICQAEFGGTLDEVAQLDDLGMAEEELDALAEETEEWTAYQGVWFNEEEGLAVVRNGCLDCVDVDEEAESETEADDVDEDVDEEENADNDGEEFVAFEQPEKYSDIDFNGYPDAAEENAQQALDARDDTDNPNDCGTRVGWARANQLADREELSPETVRRMAAFRRHEDHKDMDDEEGRGDCGWMMWKAWGGDAGIEWAEGVVERMDEIDEEEGDA